MDFPGVWTKLSLQKRYFNSMVPATSLAVKQTWTVEAGIGFQDVGRENSTRKESSLACFSRQVMWQRYFLVQQLTSSQMAALALFSTLIYITASDQQMNGTNIQNNKSVLLKPPTSIEHMTAPQFIHYGRVVVLPKRLNQKAFVRTHKTKNLLSILDKIQWLNHQNIEVCYGYQCFSDGYTNVYVQKYRGVSLSHYFFLNLSKKQHSSLMIEVTMCKILKGVTKAMQYLLCFGIRNAYITQRKVILTDLGTVKIVGWYEKFPTTQPYCNCNSLTYIFISLASIYEQMYKGSVVPEWVAVLKTMVKSCQEGREKEYIDKILEFAKSREKGIIYQSQLTNVECQIIKQINEILLRYQSKFECKVIKQAMT